MGNTIMYYTAEWRYKNRNKKQSKENSRKRERARGGRGDEEKNEAVEEKLAFPSLLILHGENMNM